MKMMSCVAQDGMRQSDPSGQPDDINDSWSLAILPSMYLI